jgi:hypothetical protein
MLQCSNYQPNSQPVPLSFMPKLQLVVRTYKSNTATSRYQSSTFSSGQYEFRMLMRE